MKMRVFPSVQTTFLYKKKKLIKMLYLNWFSLVTQNKCEVKIFRGSFCKQDPLRDPVFISLEIVCIPRTREQKIAMHLKIPVDCIPNPVENQ
jgi:hypothetical protein